MVISVFPDVSQGFARYEQSRRNRLIDQQARTEQEAMRRRRAAFNQMLGQIEDPQQRLALEAGGVEGVPAFFEGQRRAQAAQEAAAAEAEAARRAQVQQYGMGVATRRRQLAQQEGFNEDEFLRQAYDFGRSEYGMQMPYEQFVERARNPMAGEIPDVAGREVNFRQQTFEDSQGNLYEAITDPRNPQAAPIYRPLTPNAPPQPTGRLRRPQTRTIDETPAPSPVSTGDEDFDPEVFFFGDALSNAFEVGFNASNNDFGTAGFLRRAAQDIGQQVLGMRGVTFGGLRDIAMAEADPDANRERIDEFFDLSGYDGDNRQIERDFRLLAYQAASALAQQTGRGLSDRDLQQFREILGNPTSLMGNKPAYLQAVQDLDERIISRINAHRRAGDLPLIPEGVSFIDGSFQQYASSPTTYRSAPPPAPRADRTQRPPQREDFETEAEYDRALDNFYGQ